jgi:hypothetical protein
MSNYDEKIRLHIAKKIIDNHGFIYNPEILKLINVDSLVRISYYLNVSNPETWSFDAPYVRIIRTTKKNLLGEICDIGRQITNMYPLNIGDKIWFDKTNIIEIPIKHSPLDIQYQNVDNNTKFIKFVTTNKVPCTGPLYCIESDSEDESDSDSVSESESDSE